ncbi:MAG: DUF4271 domain-containing protein [Chlorobi bacterium]|nr:DUF4271 domain-containing protein [Chlorobiota bacterium]
MPKIFGSYYFFQPQDTSRQIKDTSFLQHKDTVKQDLPQKVVPVSHLSLDNVEKIMAAAEKRLQKIDSTEKTVRTPVQQVEIPKPKPVRLDSTHLIIKNRITPVRELGQTFHDLTAFDGCPRPFQPSSGNVFILPRQPGYTSSVTLNASSPVRIRETSLLKENWMLPVLLSAFILITWARLVFGRMFNQTLISFWNRKSATRLIVTRSSLYQRLSIALLLNYLLTGTLFLYLAFKNFDLFSTKITPLQHLPYFAGTLFILFLYGLITTWLVGVVGMAKNLMQNNFQYLVLFFHNAGLYLFPFAALVPYIGNNVANIFIYSAISIVLVLYLLRLFWLVVLFVQQKFSLFYLFLYLCALEFLPLFIFIRIIFS